MTAPRFQTGGRHHYFFLFCRPTLELKLLIESTRGLGERKKDKCKNGHGGSKSGQGRNSWQWAKHAWLYWIFWPTPSLKEEYLSTVNSGSSAMEMTISASTDARMPPNKVGKLPRSFRFMWLEGFWTACLSAFLWCAMSQHFSYLTYAGNQERTSTADITVARDLLHTFCSGYASLYETSMLTNNVQRGTQNVDEQICRNVGTQQGLPQLAKYMLPGLPAFNLYKKMASHRKIKSSPMPISVTRFLCCHISHM